MVSSTELQGRQGDRPEEAIVDAQQRPSPAKESLSADSGKVSSEGSEVSSSKNRASRPQGHRKTHSIGNRSGLGEEPEKRSQRQGPDGPQDDGEPLLLINGSPSTDPKVRNPAAIRLDSAHKHYGSRKSNKMPVLIGLDMEVEKGTIYGLLGPSGCGKTTLLKCIVGKLKLDGGTITVFGDAPGTPGLGVPGPRVGYMPQELALFGEFNIAETLRYFSRIFGMTSQKFEERMDFLMKFLDLPSRTRMLQKMSGGQQRRASLAVALLHEPDLLILDEPTVGVDPLLRTSIWSHLIDLASSPSKSSSSSKLGKSCNQLGGTTIVITTHYIEEAKQANRVGMMRFGKMLAEGSPDTLLKSYNKPSLEDVFLDLCLKDGDLETTRVREERSERRPIILTKKASKWCDSAKSSDNFVMMENGKVRGDGKDKLEGFGDVNDLKTAVMVPKSKTRGNLAPPNPSKTGSKLLNISPMKVNACMIKTFNRMKKRIGFLIYQFVLPALQVSLFCLAIGQDPKDLPVAIVNPETDIYGGCANGTFNRECPVSLSSFGILKTNENLSNFTCRYLSFLDSNIIHPVFYIDHESAREAVENGEAWGVLEVKDNFTHNLYTRIFESMTASDLTQIDRKLLNESSITISMDVTNQHIAYSLQLEFVEAFDSFMKQLVSSCGIPAEVASVPLIFDKPIFGTHELTFTDFMAPGIILTIVHSMAIGYSAMIIIIERNEGLLDRTWVAGVNPGEFALAHFLVSLVMNLLQVIVTLIFMIVVFQVPAEGSIVWIFLLTMLQGIAGTTIGLIISAVCETQQDATQISLGIFYPNLILSGIIWPVESMPTALRYIAYILPQTFACDAMRGILLRGWGITYMPVWRGYLVTIAWIVATYALFKRLMSKEA